MYLSFYDGMWFVPTWSIFTGPVTYVDNTSLLYSVAIYHETSSVLVIDCQIGPADYASIILSIIGL